MARYRAPAGYELLTGKRNASTLSLPGRAPSLLCIHGFCGVPQEMAVGLRVAKTLGLGAHAPLLIGHGGTPDELAPLRFDDFYADIRRHYLNARRRGPVILFGMSMGSLLALQLLQEEEEALGAILLANACWLRGPLPAGILRVLDRFGLPDLGLPLRERKLWTQDAQESNTRAYHVLPLQAAMSILEASHRIRKDLGQITQDLLIVHGSADPICPVKNAWRLATQTPQSQSEVVVLAGVKHVLSSRAEEDLLVAPMTRYIQRVITQS